MNVNGQTKALMGYESAPPPAVYPLSLSNLLARLFLNDGGPLSEAITPQQLAVPTWLLEKKLEMANRMGMVLAATSLKKTVCVRKQPRSAYGHDKGRNFRRRAL